MYPENDIESDDDCIMALLSLSKTQYEPEKSIKLWKSLMKLWKSFIRVSCIDLSTNDIIYYHELNARILLRVQHNLKLLSNVRDKKKVQFLNRTSISGVDHMCKINNQILWCQSMLSYLEIERDKKAEEDLQKLTLIYGTILFHYCPKYSSSVHSITLSNDANSYIESMETVLENESDSLVGKCFSKAEVDAVKEVIKNFKEYKGFLLNK